jgi:hypothetical protein
MTSQEKSFEEIETEYKDLIKRISSLSEDKMRVDATLSSRKQRLKEVMEEAKEAGIDPDNLSDNIKKLKTILTTKMEVMKADIETAERIIKPVVETIE